MCYLEKMVLKKVFIFEIKPLLSFCHQAAYKLIDTNCFFHSMFNCRSLWTEPSNIKILMNILHMDSLQSSRKLICPK